MRRRRLRRLRGDASEAAPRRRLRVRPRRHAAARPAPRAGSREGLRGPSRRARPARVRVDRRRLATRPRSRSSSSTSCTSARSAPRGRSTARSPHLAALAELGVTAIELMPVAEFPGARGWGYDGVYLCAAHRAYGGPARPRALRRRRPRARASRCILDVVYNHVGASGQPGAAGVRPLLHRQVLDVLGRGDELRRRRLGRGARVGRCRPPRAGSATSTSTACASTRSTRSSTPAPEHIVAASSPAGCTRRDRGAIVIAESGLNDPKVDARRRAQAAGAATRAWADDFHHALRVAADRRARGLLRRVRPRRRPGQGVPPPARARRHLSTFRGRALRRARRTTSRRERVRRLLRQNHDQVGNRAARRPAAGRGAAAGRVLRRCCHRSRRCCSWARSTASARRSSSSPTTSTRRSPMATREGRRREFAAFAAFAGEEVPDPQDAGDVRALQAHARRASRGAARPATGALLRAAPRSCRRGDVEPADCDEHGRWLRRAPRRPRAGLPTSPARSGGAAATARELVLATHDGGTGSSDGARRAAAAGRSARPSEPRGLARPAVPARRHVGRRRARTSRCSPSTPSASSCACSTTRTTRSASRSTERHGPHTGTCYLPGVGPGPALRLPRPRPVRRRRTGTASTRPSC